METESPGGHGASEKPEFPLSAGESYQWGLLETKQVLGPEFAIVLTNTLTCADLAMYNDNTLRGKTKPTSPNTGIIRIWFF